MSGRLTKMIIWVVSVLVASSLLFVISTKVKLPKLHREVAIEPTVAVVTQIRAMSRLVTACFYDEVVLTSSKKREVSAFGAPIPVADDEICIIADGKVRAGIDFSTFSADNFSISGDTLMVRLPSPEVFDVIINPSGYEVFAEEGKWSHDEVVALASRASAKVRTDAIASGLMDKAAVSARRQLDALFRSMGYSEVVFVSENLPLLKE